MCIRSSGTLLEITTATKLYLCVKVDTKHLIVTCYIGTLTCIIKRAHINNFYYDITKIVSHYVRMSFCYETFSSLIRSSCRSMIGSSNKYILS